MFSINCGEMKLTFALTHLIWQMVGLYQIDPNANSPWDDIGPKGESAKSI